jgi:hypothetical protein
MRHYRAISIVIQPAHPFPILFHHIVAVNQYPVPCHDETAHMRINHMVRTPASMYLSRLGRALILSIELAITSSRHVSSPTYFPTHARSLALVHILLRNLHHPIHLSNSSKIPFISCPELSKLPPSPLGFTNYAVILYVPMHLNPCLSPMDHGRVGPGKLGSWKRNGRSRLRNVTY